MHSVGNDAYAEQNTYKMRYVDGDGAEHDGRLRDEDPWTWKRQRNSAN